ncbi:MAG: HIT family protein [Candidatus Liptonbacteria bacterium]|nr:HIT family protein [Candidatus Liptonbacteria bacterium]
MPDPNCLFCKIAGGQAPAHVVGQNDHALAFLDVHPCAPGHTMVIPKTHVEKLSELPPDEIGPLFQLVSQVATRLEEKLNAEGLTIGINQGEASHRGLAHLHVHLLSRYLNDQGGSVHTIVNNPPRENLEEMVEKLIINE